jgi:hypothetical protein
MRERNTHPRPCQGTSPEGRKEVCGTVEGSGSDPSAGASHCHFLQNCLFLISELQWTNDHNVHCLLLWGQRFWLNTTTANQPKLKNIRLLLHKILWLNKSLWNRLYSGHLCCCYFLSRLVAKWVVQTILWRECI